MREHSFYKKTITFFKNIFIIKLGNNHLGQFLLVERIFYKNDYKYISQYILLKNKHKIGFHTRHQIQQKVAHYGQ